MIRTLAAHLLTLAVLAAPAWPATAVVEEQGSLLVPVYDRFEDVGALMTPTIKVELNSLDATRRGDLFFSVFHHGKGLEGLAIQRVLLSLSSELNLFDKGERARLIVIADRERLVFEDVEFVGQEGIGLPIRNLRVWIPVADLDKLARATTVDCRAGRCEFSLPPEMLGHLRDLSSRLAGR